MVFVFDVSFIGALIIPDEKNPQVDKMYEKIKNEDERYTPQLLWYEIANVFKNLTRRRRCTSDEVIQLFPHLIALDLKTDYETGSDYSQKLLQLCNEYNLSSYDAAYLELAERTEAILCTLDENLQSAAKKRGVKVIK